MNDKEIPPVPDSGEFGQPPAVLIAALRKLLRPLVRLLLDFQVSYPYLISLLKSTYVEVAEKDFAVNEKRPSDSRITLLTGVHRKDVKRLRGVPQTSGAVPRSVSTGAQLIAHWMGSDRFRDAAGKPLSLPLRDALHPESDATFDELVEQVCRQDIRPKVILDEWLRLGVAHLDEHDRVILNTGAFTPTRGLDEKVFFFGKNIHDHIAAGAHNLRAGQPPLFDRSVYYDQLSEESLEQLAKLAAELGMQALVRMNQEALRLQQQDKLDKSTKVDSTSIRYRMNFGIFHYNDRIDPPVKDNDHA